MKKANELKLYLEAEMKGRQFADDDHMWATMVDIVQKDARYELEESLASAERASSINCLEWQMWERWAAALLTDFRIPFDNNPESMQGAIARAIHLNHKAQP